MKQVIITGASGFIGRNLIKKMLRKNYFVTAIVPNPEALDEFENQNISIIKAEFSDFDNISKLISHGNYDEFYYLAWGGYGKSTNDYRVQINNIKPVCAAVVSAKKIGCKRFIFASSFSEYMILENEMKTHSNGASANVYGSVKNAARIIAHSVAKQENIDFVSVAFANTFGPGDYSKRSPNMIMKKMLLDEEVDLTEGIHLYDWNYIEDTVRGLILASEKGYKDEFYYIGNFFRWPLKKIIFRIKSVIDSRSKINIGKYIEKYHLDYSSIDVNKLYNHTGYLAEVDFDKAILETAKWVNEIKGILDK